MKKILLLSVDTGAGYPCAAEAISAFAAIDPAVVQATTLDVLDFVDAGFREIFTGLYGKVVADYPELWGYLYRAADQAKRHAPGQRLLRAIERFRCRALLSEIERQRPDAIICTHFLPAQLLSREIRKHGLTLPVWVQIIDFDLNSKWIVPGMLGYFVANEEIAWRARVRGVPADRIFVSGIPVMPAFSAPLERRDCAARFGLDPARKTLLLLSGAAGLNGLLKLTERLLAIPADFQLVVLPGSGQAMSEALLNLAQRHPGRLFLPDCADQVERLMACADLSITQSVGVMVAECLAMGLPMIVHPCVRGQEERNADFLLEQGAALKAISEEAVAFRVESLLAAPGRLANMRQQSAELGCPQAGRTVLDRVLGSVPPDAETA